MNKRLSYLFNRAHLFILLIVPAILTILSILITDANDKFYYVSSYDPSYLYLQNSLNVANGLPPQHFDNPGVTLQILGGVIIKIIELVKDVSPVEIDVLQNPEYYLGWIHLTLVAINVFLLVLSGYVIFRLTRNIRAGLIFQCFWFTGIVFFFMLIKVSPEHLLIVASQLMILLLMWIVHKDNVKQKTNLYVLLFSAIAAFGLATKYTFLSLCIIPLFVLPTLRSRVYYIIAVVLLFHVFIIPILGYYPFIVSGIFDLFFHSGKYGAGPEEVINLPSFSANLIDLLSRFYLLTGVMLISIPVGVIAFRYKAGRTIERKVLSAVIAAVIFHIILVSKHYNFHYLIPVLVLIPLLFYLSAQLAIPMLKTRTATYSLAGFILLGGVIMYFAYRGYLLYYIEGMKVSNTHLFLLFLLPVALSLLFIVLQRKHLAIITICMLFFLMHYRQMDIPLMVERLAQTSRESEKVESLLAERFAGVPKLIVNLSSSKNYALTIAVRDNYPYYAGLLKDIYPNEEVFLLESFSPPQMVTQWQKQVLLDKVLKDKEQLIVQGISLDPRVFFILKDYGFEVQEVYKSNVESVYLASKGS